MKPEVETHIRRGDSSRYAEQIRDMEFGAITHVVVAQNTPTWFRINAPTALDAPLEGWKEKNHLRHADLQTAIHAADTPDGVGPNKMVWIKTATLGGRSKMFVRTT